MKKLLIGVLVLIVGNLFADIGDTPESAEKKYGKGTINSRLKDDKADLMDVKYKTDKFLITQYYHNSKCYRMSSEFLHPEQPTEATLIEVLKKNFPTMYFPIDSPGYSKQKHKPLDMLTLKYRNAEAYYYRFEDEPRNYMIEVRNIKADAATSQDFRRLIEAKVNGK